MTHQLTIRLPLVSLLLGALAIFIPSTAAARPVLRVVLDPGHGGSNLGAAGHVEGVHEKQLTLAVARLLRKRLERDGITVVTTRDADTYLTLGERVRRANAAGADLFISLHANAAPDHARHGVEAYVLSREVRDLEAQRAARPVSPNQPVDAAESMLARARVRFVAQESARLAHAVQQRLGQAREGDRGVRQASYDVLESLVIPATLVEVGFIDNPSEGLALLKPEVMHRIANAIADGVEDFSVRGQGEVADH